MEDCVICNNSLLSVCTLIPCKHQLCAECLKKLPRTKVNKVKGVLCPHCRNFTPEDKIECSDTVDGVLADIDRHCQQIKENKESLLTDITHHHKTQQQKLDQELEQLHCQLDTELRMQIKQYTIRKEEINMNSADPATSADIKAPKLLEFVPRQSLRSQELLGVLRPMGSSEDGAKRKNVIPPIIKPKPLPVLKPQLDTRNQSPDPINLKTIADRKLEIAREFRVDCDITTYRMCLHEDEIYIPDRSKKRVLLYSPDGDFKNEITVNFNPVSVVGWKAKEILVAGDTGLYRIDMNTDDNEAYQIHDGRFIDVCTHNNVIAGIKVTRVAGIYTYKVHIFDHNQIPTAHRSFDVKFRRSKMVENINTVLLYGTSVYACEHNFHMVYRFDHTNADPISTKVRYGDFGQHSRDHYALPGKLHFPTICSIDSNHNVLVADSRNQRLQVLSSSGTWHEISLNLPQDRTPIYALVQGDSVYVFQRQVSSKRPKFKSMENLADLDDNEKGGKAENCYISVFNVV